jgi:hypothetical protein
MPTKALLRAGEGMREAKRTHGVRGAVSGEIDVAEVLVRRTA